MMLDSVQIGLKVQVLRKNANLTQEGLAEKLDIS